MTTPRSVSIGETSSAKEEKGQLPVFQLFSASVNVDGFGVGTPFFLHGEILLGTIPLFYCHKSEPLTMLNHSYINTVSPICFPVFSDIHVNSHLNAITVDDQMSDTTICLLDDGDSVVHISIKKYDTFCCHKIKGPGGYIDLRYIILSDPVFASLEITFFSNIFRSNTCSVHIFAYYGGEYGEANQSVTLLADDILLTHNSRIAECRLAVPANDSLKIRALIIEKSSRKLIMSTLYKFHVKLKGSTNVFIEGVGCTLNMNLKWDYSGATDEENYDLKNDVEELKTGDNPEVEAEILFDEEHADMQTETQDPPKITDADHGQSDAVIGQEKAEYNTEPLKNYPTPRFQLFEASICIDKYPVFDKCFLHGFFSVSDVSNDPANHFIFKRDLFEPLLVCNTCSIYPLPHPSRRYSIPIHSFPFLNISAYLYAITLDKKLLFFEVSNGSEVLNFSDKKYDTFYTEMIKGAHGNLKLSYIVIKDPVDATLEMKLIPDYDVSGRTFWIDISAFYGIEDDDCGLIYYGIDLLQGAGVALLKNKKIPLNISCLAVPAKASLKIKAVIGDLSPDRDLIMKAYHEFPVQLEGSSHVCIKEKSCSLEVKVNWVYDAALPACHEELKVAEEHANIKVEELT